MSKNSLIFPQQQHLEAVKAGLAGIIGRDSFTRSQHQGGAWEAEIYLSSSGVFEKASAARVDLCGGSVEGVPTDITLLQAFAWPAQPHKPGMIIMASASSSEGGDPIITFFTDLIAQTGSIRQADQGAYSAALAAVCQRHGRDIAEYQALLAGRGMLGECAAECGMLYFFEQSDAPILDDIIRASLGAYAAIVGSEAEPAAPGDVAAMRSNRKKIIDWMVTQDYGVKVSRQNDIPMEVIEAYGFPPVAKP